MSTPDAAATTRSPGAGNPLTRFLTGKWTALLVIAAYLAVVAGVNIGLGGLESAARGSNLPGDAQSRVVADALARFPGSERAPVLVVASRADGAALTEQQFGSFAALAARLTGAEKPPLIPSEDKAALRTLVDLPASEDDTRNRDNVNALRDTIAGQAPADLVVQVTGGPAFGADISDSFSGADVTLLLVTVGIVAVLLLVTYRSPVLWLVPLLVVGLADQMAASVTNAVSVATNWHAEAGIVSVLVFGAGTNYALLLISRHREELAIHEDHREAMRTAWRGSVSAIVASNLTVVLGLLSLVLATLPDTRGLGLASAFGLVIALLSVLLVLPAALSLFGRKIFWPFIPRPDRQSADAPGLWGRVARAVVSHPVRSLLGGLALLAVMATGLFGVRVGLDQADQFRVDAESIDGLEVVAAHYPAGFTAPITVLANTPVTQQVIAAVSAVPGVESVQPTGADPSQGLTAIQVVGKHVPGTAEALDLVRDLRTAVAPIEGADARVGGQIAEDLDQREAQSRDFWVAAPLVLAASLLVLIGITRALLAPVLLLTVNLASAAAAIGAGWVLSEWVMGSPALAIQVPLFAFIFLVALGIDYTIFLIERAKAEAAVRGTRDGMVEAVRRTGAVITSAGVVLAAVFAALGVLPLVVMGQLGIIVGIGVLVDTLVVRTVIVPALFGLLGDRIWWPRRPAARD